MWKGLKPYQRRQAEILRHGVNWLADGTVFVRIQDMFPLAKAAEARGSLEGSGGSGKIILTMPGWNATAQDR